MTAEILIEKDRGFWSPRSFRFYLSQILCLGILSMSTVRNALGMAMVCMINSTAVMEKKQGKLFDNLSYTHAVEDTGQCPALSEDYMQGYDGFLTWTSAEQGIVFSAIYWGGVIAGLPVGWLINKYSPKNLIMGGFGILFLSCVLSPVAAEHGGVIATFIVRFVQGMCSQVLFTPSTTMIISYWVPMTERSTAMSMSTSGNQIAMIIGPPANAWLCQQKQFLGGWPVIFYANGLFILLSALIWWIFISDYPEHNRWVPEREKAHIKASLGGETKALLAKHKIPWRQVLSSATLWSCYLCAFANGLMTSTLTSYIPTYYKDALHLDLNSSGILNATPFIVQWVSKVIFSVAADMMKKRTKISHNLIVKSFNCLGTFGVCGFLIACGYMKCTQQIWAVFFLTMANAAFSGLVPGYVTSLVCISPSLNGIINGITRFVAQIASVLAPYIVGGVVTNGTAEEWRIVFFIMAGAMFFAGLAFLFFGTAEITDFSETKSDQSVDAQKCECQKKKKKAKNVVVDSSAIAALSIIRLETRV